MNVNFDDIEINNFDAGGGAEYYYNNEPFTGTIVEFNNNVLIGEITVVGGYKKGRVAIYYDNGQIMEEHFESFNRPYGNSRKWDENGNLVKQIDFGTEYQP
ncbi:MAG TPA: hypothetical protein VIV55_01970 [Flavobacterium sp.]